MLRKIINWFKEGLDDFKSPYPEEPPMTLKQWLTGALDGAVFILSMAVLLFLITLLHV